MGRGLAPPPAVALAPLEDVPTRQMPKTMPSSPSQGEAKRLKRPGARYFPAEETTLVYPSRPAVPKPTVARPLNGSMKGFGRVPEDRIRPSADLADKVYFAPVVPGLPQRKRPRRPRILEPLAPSMASVAQLRNKVMGALDSALRSERVPQDMRYRLLGTVEQVMDGEMEVPDLEELPTPSPRTQAIQMVQDKVKIKLAPTVEPVEAAVQTPARSQEAEAAASTRPPSSVVQAPLDDAESAEVPEAIDEDEVVLVDVCEADDQLLNLVADEVMDNVFATVGGEDV